MSSMENADIFRLKIALVYDRLTTTYGGAEVVLRELHKLLPQAEIFTSVHDPQRTPWTKGWTVHTTWLQYLPGAKRNYRWLVWLMPLAFESLNLDKYDLVISVSSAEAKGVLTKSHQLHLCYLLSPPRYLYSHREEIIEWLPNLPLIQTISTSLLKYLRWWDQAAAHRPDVIIPISRLVSQRVRKYYFLSASKVLYPPVIPLRQTSSSALSKYQLTAKTYCLTIARLVPEKKIELAIAACNQLNLPLVIVGTGPSYHRLFKQAGPLTKFIGKVTDQEKTELIRQAQVFIQPGIEDFGLTALEAVGLRCPVVINNQSGCAELIPNDKLAVHFSGNKPEDIVVAVKKALTLPMNSDTMTTITSNLSSASFHKRWKKLLETEWRKHVNS